MDDTFAMEAYVRQRLAEIDDLDERRFAKEVLLEGLLSVLNLTEKRYLDLEKRVAREIEISDSKYTVFIHVIREEDYDPINETLFPVCPRTKKDDEGKERRPFIIYFAGDYEEKLRFEKQGELDAYDEKGNNHKVGIKKAICYQNAVAELYDVFVYNKRRWTTVNTGYLDRFYEIYPLEEEDYDISKWDINYGLMKPHIQGGMIPLWNIEKFTFQCMKFMVPCIDDKYYEHELDLQNFDLNSGYMLGINEDVISIRYEENKIIMTSLKESFKDWTAYRFVQRPDYSSYGYGGAVLGNGKQKSFAEGLVKKQGCMFASKTEIMREFESLNVDTYIELLNCRVSRELPEKYLQADMNWFIRNEIFPIETRKILEFCFRKKDETSILCEDMVRFVVSQMQLSLNEYRCIGVLV